MKRSGGEEPTLWNSGGLKQKKTKIGQVRKPFIQVSPILLERKGPKGINSTSVLLSPKCITAIWTYKMSSTSLESKMLTKKYVLLVWAAGLPAGQQYKQPG